LSAPILFWHIQKSGGTTFCSLAIESIVADGWPDGLSSKANCNHYKFGVDVVVEPSSYMDIYRPKNIYFVAIEPGNWITVTKDVNFFPSFYHDMPSTQILLNPIYGARREAAWDSIVHTIGTVNDY
jgi:hypothetical protein